MRPVYRFNVQGKIFVFGLWGRKNDLPVEIVREEFLDKYPFVRLPDGSNVRPEQITNLKRVDIKVDVGFLLCGNGQLMKVI